VRAIISDVHSNLEALTAVFEDIDAHGAGAVYFLGDLVGYGPDPEACTDLIMKRCAVSLKGNHDYALINGSSGFNYIAAEAIDCTRAVMLPSRLSPDRAKNDRWEFIDNLKMSHTEGDVLFIHGSPIEPLSDYVFCKQAKYLWNEEKLGTIFSRIERIMFCGHTHHPCVIYEDLQCRLPREIESRVVLEDGRKMIINVGSVGQPRDQDNRACYVLLDDAAKTVTWRRVPYDFETTARKIEATACIDRRCGDRLRFGV
jgi:diadenosine tetraphosphatase ApaH/serine/threonine PP2A family protein phosphatase